MNKKKILILSIMLIAIFGLSVGAVSSASFYVNKNTSHKDITDWINNKAVKADKLIFNTSSYDLNSTIVINKPIYVSSYKNTKVIMNSNTSMFDINTTAVSFIGLNLINNGKTEYDEDYWPQISCAINGISGNYVKLNLKNTNITSSVGIDIYKIDGAISNSKITTQLTSIMTSYWKGNLINSEIKSDLTGIGAYKLDTHWNPDLKWAGNIINSNITSRFESVYCGYWKGKISGSRIYSYGTSTNQKTPALVLGYSQGIITKSIARSNSANAIYIRKAVKITSNKLISKKGYSKVHYYLPDLRLGMNDNKNNYIYVQVENSGYENSKSSSYLVYKCGNTIKKAYIPPLKSGKFVWVKINIPKSMYMKYKIVKFKVDYYNKVKEENEKNNYHTMTFS